MEKKKKITKIVFQWVFVMKQTCLAKGNTFFEMDSLFGQSNIIIWAKVITIFIFFLFYIVSVPTTEAFTEISVTEGGTEVSTTESSTGEIGTEIGTTEISTTEGIRFNSK